MDAICSVSVPLNSDVLITPVFGSRPVIEKFRSIRVHSSFTAAKSIISHSYSIPVHLPETGCTISLDLTSENLAAEFMELMHELKTRRKIRAITTRLYNFDSARNRAVSWGNFTAREIDDDIHRIHMVNLFNDLMFSPSFMAKNGVWSPLRWSVIESTGEYRYRCIYTYNSFIVYLEPESVQQCRKIRVWLGNPVDLYAVRGGFIELTDTGRVGIRKVYLCFPEDPAEILQEKMKGYYICFSESFNRYATNYPEFHFRSLNLNLVDDLSPVLHSPYDIVPFISPFFICASSDPLLSFRVPENVIRTIIRRFERFGGSQSRGMIESYERKIFENINGLVRIRRDNNTVIVTLVNPTVISHMVRMLVSGHRLAEKHARRILKRGGSGVLQLLLQTGSDFSGNPEMMMALPGCGRLLEKRRINLEKYLEIFRNFSGSSSRKK